MDRAAIVDVQNNIVNIAEVAEELPPLPEGLAWLHQSDWADGAVPLIGGTWNGATPAEFAPPSEETA